VPLEAAGKVPSTDPLERHLLARFFERGEQDRFTEFSKAATAEVYGAGTPPGEAPGGSPNEAVDMRALLIRAAKRYGLKKVSLDPSAGKLVRTKDGVRGKTWTHHVDDRLRAQFGVWEKDGMQIGVWIGGEWPEREYALGFHRVISSLLWTDDDAAGDAPSLPALAGVNLSPDRRREIERGLVRGWGVTVSPAKRYVVVFNTKNGRNAKLARIVAERIEAIRSQLYEVHFPPKRPFDDVSVVRVCADAHEYGYYGGPSGSAGYWSTDTEELVFYDASPKRAVDDDTLAVLYHEAFHQYIYYSAGRIMPHPWFNEGHGDYYAGATFRDGKFQILPFRWRLGPIQSAIARGEMSAANTSGHVPLDMLVSASQRQYYLLPARMYAGGWSLVYFLREVVPKNPEWSARWGHVIDTYFRTLCDAFDETITSGQGAAPPGGAVQDPTDDRPEGAADGSGIGFVLRDGTMSAIALARAQQAAFAGIDLESLGAAWAQEIARLKLPR
jgi:hypothetical protein